MLVPDSLEEARSLLGRLPPPPPGRNVQFPMAKRARQCHGCHGFSGQDHESIAMGASKCPLDHDVRCQGGIIAGKDSKGREWRPCPPNYVGPGEQDDDYDGNTADDDDSDYGEDDYSLNHGTAASTNMNNLGSAFFASVTDSATSENNILLSTVQSPSVSIGHALPSIYSNVSRLQYISVSTSTVSNRQSQSHTSTVNSSRVPLLSTGPASDPQQELLAEMAALEKLRKEREALEEQTAIVRQQQVSAQRVELQRQLQAERDRVEQLKKFNVGVNSSLAPLPGLVSDTSQAQFFPNSFPNQYNGPNIKQIRKTKGIRGKVDKKVGSVQEDVPSLAQRPTAGQMFGARSKVKSNPTQTSQPVHPNSDIQKEFEAFREWRESRAATGAVGSDSESDATPPRAAPLRHRSGQNPDSYTDSSNTHG